MSPGREIQLLSMPPETHYKAAIVKGTGFICTCYL